MCLTALFNKKDTGCWDTKYHKIKKGVLTSTFLDKVLSALLNEKDTGCWGAE